MKLLIIILFATSLMYGQDNKVITELKVREYYLRHINKEMLLKEWYRDIMVRQVEILTERIRRKREGN